MHVYTKHGYICLHDDHIPKRKPEHTNATEGVTRRLCEKPLKEEKIVTLHAKDIIIIIMYARIQ